MNFTWISKSDTQTTRSALQHAPYHLKIYSRKKVGILGKKLKVMFNHFLFIKFYLQININTQIQKHRVTSYNFIDILF